MCEGELILCFVNIQFFLQFFEISEVSNGEWVAQKLIFVQEVHPSRSLSYLAYPTAYIEGDIFYSVVAKNSCFLPPNRRKTPQLKYKNCTKIAYNENTKF